MRGGSPGHVLVFVVAVRSVICFFVCAVCIAFFCAFDCYVCWSVFLICLVLWCMRGGYLGHVSVFVVAVRYVVCVFVCAVCVACFACFVCYVWWALLLSASWCKVRVAFLLVTYMCLWSWFVMSCVSLFVLVVLIALFVFCFITFDGVWC